MKLSQIKGERCFDVIAELVEPVAAIAQDKKAMELLKPKQPPEGVSQKEFFIERMKKGLPSLMKDHKQDFIAIMASINGVTPAQYVKKLNLATLFSDVIDMLNDEELLAFLS